MSSPPHHINPRWTLLVDRQGPTLAEAPLEHNDSGTVESPQPALGLPRLGGVPIVLPDSLYDEFEYCEHHAKQYDDLVRDHPELAVSLADIPPAIRDTIFPNIPSESSEYTFGNQFTTEITSQNGATTTLEGPRDSASVSPSPLASSPSPSALRVGYQHKHHCLECSAGFDRATRARDHRFKDLGQTPYTCGGTCGRSNCTTAYWSEELLDHHLLPPEERKMPCPQCSLEITKKNLARHQKTSCPKRELPAKENDRE